METMGSLRRTNYCGEVSMSNVGQEMTVCGSIARARDKGGIIFADLRDTTGILQLVFDEDTPKDVFAKAESLKSEYVVICRGLLRERAAKTTKIATGDVELYVSELRILSEAQTPPFEIRDDINVNDDLRLRYRYLDLRRPSMHEPIVLRSKIMQIIRSYFCDNHFTEIETPTLIKSTPEGARDYLVPSRVQPGHFYALPQSPQLYKQMMVGVFDRVFETAPVFRAEKHNTKRHLNEYTSLDFEMGYIDGFEDIMEMETGFLQYTMELLKTSYAKELELLKIKLPDVTSIPRVRFDEAKQRVAEKYNRQFRNPFDLEPEEEVLIGQYFKEEYGSDFVFVTHYPSKKRPFYAMDDPADETYTLSFDLLFRGLEITTGGQRIHDYNKLMEKIAKRGMETEGMESYLSAFKHGMPPHGGLGIGLERLTMQLIGEDNVREATLFPRDLSRLEP